MKISKRNSKVTYCPLERDIVKVIPDCALCRFWDGKNCRFLDAATGLNNRSRVVRSGRKTLERLGRHLSHRRGKRLEEPVLKERRPSAEPEGTGIPDQGDGSEYGIAGSLAEEGLHQEPKRKKKDKYILPELIKEIWDVEPDRPDWPFGEDLNVTPEQKPPDNPILEETPVEPFPPDFLQELGSENLIDGIPGPGPDTHEPGLP
jgi:hypothetical protein